jgi:hypothetical protein
MLADGRVQEKALLPDQIISIANQPHAIGD